MCSSQSFQWLILLFRCRFYYRNSTHLQEVPRREERICSVFLCCILTEVSLYTFQSWYMFYFTWVYKGSGTYNFLNQTFHTNYHTDLLARRLIKHLHSGLFDQFRLYFSDRMFFLLEYYGCHLSFECFIDCFSLLINLLANG